jgi:hypothetical protein
MVAQILVKQAVERVDLVNVQLSQAFEKNDQLQFETLIQILKEYSTEFSRTSNMFVIFDALDECQYFGKLVKLIQNLTKFGIRVYATARDHYENSLRHLQTQPLKIEANIQDVENYLVQELEENALDIDSTFREEIVNEIAPKVDGM